MASGGLFDFLGQDGCETCIAQNCQSVVDACLTDDGCASTQTCYEACGITGGPACRFGCRSDLEAEPLYNAVELCADTCLGVCMPEPRFECVGTYDLPTPIASTITDRNAWGFYTDSAPAAGVVVNACLETDPDCEAPVATDIADADGQTEHGLDIAATLGRDVGFHGFYEVNGADTYPYLLAFDTPILFGRDYRQTGVLGTDDLDTVAAIVGEEVLPGLAHLAIETTDCVDSSAAGVVIEIEPSGGERITYFDGLVPNGSLQSTSTGTSLAGVLNATPVALRVIGRVDGRVVYDATVPTRPDTITYIRLEPLRR